MDDADDECSDDNDAPHPRPVKALRKHMNPGGTLSGAVGDSFSTPTITTTTSFTTAVSASRWAPHAKITPSAAASPSPPWSPSVTEGVALRHSVQTSEHTTTNDLRPRRVGISDGGGNGDDVLNEQADPVSAANPPAAAAAPCVSGISVMAGGGAGSLFSSTSRLSGIAETPSSSPTHAGEYPWKSLAQTLATIQSRVETTVARGAGTQCGGAVQGTSGVKTEVGSSTCSSECKSGADKVGIAGPCPTYRVGRAFRVGRNDVGMSVGRGREDSEREDRVAKVDPVVGIQKQVCGCFLRVYVCGLCVFMCLSGRECEGIGFKIYTITIYGVFLPYDNEM